MEKHLKELNNKKFNNIASGSKYFKGKIIKLVASIILSLLTIMQTGVLAVDTRRNGLLSPAPTPTPTPKTLSPANSKRRLSKEQWISMLPDAWAEFLNTYKAVCDAAENENIRRTFRNNAEMAFNEISDVSHGAADEAVSAAYDADKDADEDSYGGKVVYTLNPWFPKYNKTFLDAWRIDGVAYKIIKDLPVEDLVNLIVVLKEQIVELKSVIVRHQNLALIPIPTEALGRFSRERLLAGIPETWATFLNTYKAVCDAAENKDARRIVREEAETAFQQIDIASCWSIATQAVNMAYGADDDAISTSFDEISYYYLNPWYPKYNSAFLYAWRRGGAAHQMIKDLPMEDLVNFIKVLEEQTARLKNLYPQK